MKFLCCCLLAIFYQPLLANQTELDSIKVRLTDFEITYEELINEDFFLNKAVKLRRKRKKKFGKKKAFKNFKIQLSYTSKISGEIEPKFVYRSDTLFISNVIQNPRELDKGKKLYQEFAYSFEGINREGITVFFNHIQVAPKVKRQANSFQLLEGDTINKIDGIGRKQGQWMTQYKSRTLYFLDKEKWINDTLVAKTTKRFKGEQLTSETSFNQKKNSICVKKYNEQNRLISVWKESDDLEIGAPSYTSYFDDGTVKTIKYNYSGPNAGIYKKVFYQNGQLKTQYEYHINHIKIIGFHLNNKMRFLGRNNYIPYHLRANKMETFLVSKAVSSRDFSKCQGDSFKVNCRRWDENGMPLAAAIKEFCSSDFN